MNNPTVAPSRTFSTTSTSYLSPSASKICWWCLLGNGEPDSSTGNLKPSSASFVNIVGDGAADMCYSKGKSLPRVLERLDLFAGELVKEKDQRKISVLRQPIYLRIPIGDSMPETRSPKRKRFPKLGKATKPKLFLKWACRYRETKTQVGDSFFNFRRVHSDWGGVCFTLGSQQRLKPLGESTIPRAVKVGQSPRAGPHPPRCGAG
nr:patatin-like protein 3 [Ipomoea trifida]